MLDPSIITRIQQEFSQGDQSAIQTLLARYGTESHHGEVVRVHHAILEISKGKQALVEQWVAMACVDYRDVLMQLG